MQHCKGIKTLKKGKVEILHIDTPHSTAEVSLFGGHVLSFVPKTDLRDRLWVSENAIFDNQSAIRGGIPVCWPWFSDAHNQDRNDLPSHGFVRTQNWRIVGTLEHSEATQVTLVPHSNNGPGWNHETSLTLTLLVGKTLKISLQTKNNDTKSVNLNCALHTYFNVKDILAVELRGLRGNYKDKTQNWHEFDTPIPYTFSQETDRVHLFAAEQVDILDGAETTKVLSSGHDSIVVWNPWAENSEKMKDMESRGYSTMLCVETALTQTFSLPPGATHCLTQEIA
ncbi:MAG: D-hexose-6-phosphate mutarotase [Aliiglaciecola sp.]